VFYFPYQSTNPAPEPKPYEPEHGKPEETTL
jgi:hypothetical protein